MKDRGLAVLTITAWVVFIVGAAAIPPGHCGDPLPTFLALVGYVAVGGSLFLAIVVALRGSQ